MKVERLAQLEPGTLVYWCDSKENIRTAALVSTAVEKTSHDYPGARVLHVERGEIVVPIHVLREASEIGDLPTPRDLIGGLPGGFSGDLTSTFFASLVATMVAEYRDCNSKSPSVRDRMDIMRAAIVEAREFAIALDRKFSPAMTASLRALLPDGAL